jgi:hypothetical protein
LGCGGTFGDAVRAGKQLQTIKGVTFVILSGGLLYLLMQRFYHQVSANQGDYQYLFDRTPRQ